MSKKLGKLCCNGKSDIKTGGWFQHEWCLYSPYSKVRDGASSSVIIFLTWTESCQTDRPHTKFACSLVSSLAIYLHCSRPGNHHNIPRPLLLLCSVCIWLLNLLSGKPHLLRPDVDLEKSRYHLLSRGVMTCAQRPNGYAMEAGAERCLWLRRT